MASLTGLINYYRFEEGELTKNLATNTDDLSLTGSSSVVSPNGTVYKTGSKSLYNTGTDNSNYYATTTNISATTACTISVWFKPNSTSTSGRILRIENNAATPVSCVGVSFFYSADGVIGIACDIGSGTPMTFASRSPSSYGLSSANWNHAVITYKAGTGQNTIISAYLNGTMIQNSTTIAQYIWGGASNIAGKLYLFGTRAYNPMAGYIDEVMVFNRALSSAEVMNLYNLNYAVSGQTSLLQTSIGSSLIVGNGFVVSGDLSTNGTITTNNGSINAGLGTITAGVLNLTSSVAPTTASGFVPTVGATGGITCGAINASGSITATGQTITCGAITATGDINAPGKTITCGAINASGSITATGQTITCGAITASGSITATGQTISCGTLDGSLAASKISGTINATQIGTIPASQITGLTSTASLPASSITAGALNIGSNTLTCKQISILNNNGGDGGSKIYDDGQLTITSDDNVYINLNNSLSGGRLYVQYGATQLSGLRVSGSEGSTKTNFAFYALSTYTNAITGAIISYSTNTGTGSSASDYSIVSEKRICASEFNAVSDVRIKTDINEIDRLDSLVKIRKIVPKYYNYIDKVKIFNPNSSYGFIAQEVQSIMPEAVFMTTEYIPNIYDIGTVFDSNKIILSTKSTSILDVSLNLKLFLNNSEKTVNIKNVIDDCTFELTCKLDNIVDNSENKIFVYGQEVHDFLTLEKNVIFTHAVGAIKELDMELEETKETVKKQQFQIDTLKQDLADLKILVKSILPNI